MASSEMDWDDTGEDNGFSIGATEKETIPEKSISRHALLSKKNITMAFGTHFFCQKLTYSRHQ